MNAVVKLIIGLMLIVAGISWYLYGSVFIPIAGVSSMKALSILFTGSMGIILLLAGLLLTWIETEEFKDIARDRKIENARRSNGTPPAFLQSKKTGIRKTVKHISKKMNATKTRKKKK